LIDTLKLNVENSLLQGKAMAVIEDSLIEFFGDDVWRVLRDHLTLSYGIQFENILESSNALKFMDSINELFPPATPFVVDRVVTRLIEAFPRIKQDEGESSCPNLLQVFYEIQLRYGGQPVLSGLGNHQHVALIYKSENDFSRILFSFRAAGIRRNQLNVIICPKELQLQIKALIKLKPKMHQDLIILDCDRLLTGTARISTSMKSLVESTWDMAISKGRSGLNVLGLCASHLLAHENTKGCMELERAWESLISKTILPVSLFCTYLWNPCMPVLQLEQNHNCGVRYF
jgi:hypothetical protein